MLSMGYYTNISLYFKSIYNKTYPINVKILEHE